MTEPPFMWRGADAVADFVDWQTQQQAERDRLLIAESACPVIEEGDDG